MSDNKVTLDQLDNSAVEAMSSSVGDVNMLNTENKTIVGALAEIVGKKEIANAIGEPLAETDKFTEMSSEINGLLSTFKTNMMNAGVVVESGDKFKALIDKIKGLTEGEGNKGIQFASGVFDTYINNNNYYTEIEFDFNPNIILLRTDCSYDPLTGSLDTGYINILYNSLDSEDEYKTIRVLSEGEQVTSHQVVHSGNRFTFLLDLPDYFNLSNTKYYAIGVGEEDTTLRDSLASILENKGVDVTEEDDMASLISKVDSIQTGGGLDIISATELPNVVTNNQIVMLTDTTPSSIGIVSFDLCNPAEGELNVCTTQLDSGNIFTFESNGINVSLPLTNSYQMVNGLKTPIAGYYGVNDTWVQFSNGYYPMFENGVYLYEDLFGNMKVSSGGSMTITNNNIVATGTMGGSSVDMINTKAIDLSKFERVEMTVSISGSGYFYFAVCPSTNFGTANAHKYVAINSGTYSLDLSSLTGTGYIGIDSTNNTQGTMSITISKIVFY